MRRAFIILFLLIVIAGLAFFYFEWESRPKNYLILYGNVDVRQVDLGFRVSGRVESMRFQEGDLVEEGVLMGSLDPQPYIDVANQSKANIESIKVSLENAELVLNRRKELVGEGGVSEEDYRNAFSQRDSYIASIDVAKAGLDIALTNLRDTEVFAPQTGTILTRIREPGTVVNVADPIYTLSLLSPVWVRAFVREPDLGKIYPGMPAEIFTDTEGGKVYYGHIGFISPVAEFTPKTVETTQLRTDLVFRLRVIADNPDLALRQGMPVTVKLPLKEAEG